MDLKSFYEKNFISLSYFCNKYLHDADKSKDTAQDCFLTLYENIKRNDDEKQVLSYLFKIARNKCLNMIRHEAVKRNNEAELIDYYNDEDKYIKEKIELTDRFLKELEKLPEQRKKIIKLSIGGATKEEIAEELNITINSVKTHKRLANKQFRALLEDLHYFFIYFFCKKDKNILHPLMRGACFTNEHKENIFIIDNEEDNTRDISKTPL